MSKKKHAEVVPEIVDPLSEEKGVEIRRALGNGSPISWVPKQGPQMGWDEFQAWVETKARQYADPMYARACAALGLAGEAGEFADLIKKELFHDKASTQSVKAKELGDCLFYIARAAAGEGIPLSLIVMEVVNKLNARYPHGFTVDRAHAHVPKDE